MDGGVRLDGSPQVIEDGLRAQFAVRFPSAAATAQLNELRGFTPELERVFVELDLDWLIGRSVDVEHLRLWPEDGAVVAEARHGQTELHLRIDARTGPEVGAGPLSLAIDFGAPIRIGGFTDLLPHIMSAFEAVFEAGTRRSPRLLVVEPARSLLRRVFGTFDLEPPDLEGAAASVELRGSTLQLTFTRGAVAPRPEAPELAEWFRLDASTGLDLGIEAQPRPLRHQRLWEAGSNPSTRTSADDLARELLVVEPGDVPALALRAQLASAGGEFASAKLALLADRLRQLGERRRPSALLMAASRFGDAEERARHLEAAVVLQPDDPRALRGLIDALVPLGRMSAAVRAARRLATSSSSPADKADAHALAGGLLQRAGELAPARRELERALRFAPEDVDVAVAWAELRNQAGERTAALADLEARIDRAPAEDRAALFACALRLGREEDPERTLVLAERALAEARPQPQVLAEVLALAEVTHAEPLAEAAIDVAEQAQVEMTPALALRLADVRERRGQPKAALELLLSVTPGQVAAEHEAAILRLGAAVDDPALERKARTELAARAFEAGEVQSAVALLEPGADGLDGDLLASLREQVEGALVRFPRSRGLLDLAVQAARQAKDVSSSVELLQARLRLEDPPELRAQKLGELARMWKSAGRPLAAVRALEEAAEMEPEATHWLERVADIHRARDDRARLAEVLGRLSARCADEEKGRAEGERGRILAALGDDEGAYAAIQSALEAGEDSPVTWSLATVLALRLERFEEARGFARSRLERAESRPAEDTLPIWVDLARVAEALDEPEALAEALEKAAEFSDPSSAAGRQLHERWLRLLQARGDLRRKADWCARLGGDERLSVPRRAEAWARAAETFWEEGAVESASQAAEAALTFETSDETVRDRVLAVLESVARTTGETERLANILERRAERLGGDERGHRARLEQVELLEGAGEIEQALAAAERAALAFPDSLMLAARYAGLAESAEHPERAAPAFARAAALAERSPRPELAPGLHARAARAFIAGGQADAARPHDEAVLEGAQSQSGASVEVLESVERLEAAAKARGDLVRRLGLLETKATLTEPPERGRALEELASLALSAGRVEQGLKALEGAVEALVGAEPARVEAMEERLDAARASAGRSRERVPALERRARRASGTDAADLWLRAARVLLDDLDDPEGALARVRAAVRSAADHEQARRLRLELLRRAGPSVELADVLEEEGARTDEVTMASGYWEEAGRVLLELPAADGEDGPTLRRRAAELARRAAAATPRAAEPLRLALEALDGLEGEIDARHSLLGQLATRTPHPEERLRCRLGRAQLLDREFRNPTSALAELEAVLDAPDGVRASALQAFFPYEPSPSSAFFVWGAEVAEAADNPEMQESFLLRAQREAPTESARAELAIRRARLLGGTLSDPDGAEAAWREVLELRPDDGSARAALLERFAVDGRFEELAEVLGADLLEQAWRSLRGPRRLQAARALYPRLPGGSRQAEVMLGLADELDAEQAEESERLLESVAGFDLDPHSARAWQRLGQRRSERGDHAGAAEAEAARARSARTEAEQAEAYAAVARHRLALGDPRAAEAALDEARAVDPNASAVREAQRKLLSQLGRFDELGAELGREALRSEMDLLFAAEDLPRAMAAARAYAGRLDTGVASHWLEVAERLEAAGDAELESEALEAAAATTSDEGEAALERLVRRAEARGDLEATAETERRRFDRASESAREERGLALARALRAWAADGGASNAEEEAETVLLSLRARGGGEAVDAALEQLWLDRERLELLGRTFGVERLAHHAERARTSNSPEVERKILRAWSKLVEGPARAQVLLRIADGWAEADVPEPELEALTLAYAAHPEPSLQERLRAAFVRAGSFDRMAEALGVETLESWWRNPNNASHPDRTAAGEALVAAWQDAGGRSAARLAEVWHEVALLHGVAERPEASEQALRAALTADPTRDDTRAELADLFAAAGRFDALGDVDLNRVEAEGRRLLDEERWSEAAQAFGALADRHSGERRAHWLFELSQLMARLDGPAAEEMALFAARDADPNAVRPAQRLAELLWDRGAHEQLIESLGAPAWVTRFKAVSKTAPAPALSALSGARELLDPRQRAVADEHAAGMTLPEASNDAERRRRVQALTSARFTWDQLGDLEAGHRVRLQLVDLLADGEDSEAHVAALEDAWNEINEPAARAGVGLSLANAYQGSAPEARRAVLEALVEGEDLPSAARIEASQQLLSGLEGDAWQAPAGRSVIIEAHELLAEAEPSAQLWMRIAELRDLDGASPTEVAEPLEAALELAEPEAKPQLQLRLRELWDAAGDWSRAEPHAAAWAKHSGDVDDWLAVAELRVWLGAHDEAEAAVDAAHAARPGALRVLEQRVHLAERKGEPGPLAERLLAFAEADVGAPPSLRAQRAIRSMEAACAAERWTEATKAAERAVTWAPIPEVVDRADAVLDAQEHLQEERLRVLRVALSQAEGEAERTVRLRLVDRLDGMERGDEAETVLVAGLGAVSAASDPLVDKMLARKATETRLLEWADRLGESSAAQRLRAAAASRAEARGDREVARSAWSQIASTVQTTDDEAGEARVALVRLARESDDPEELVSVLEEVAEDAGLENEAVAAWLEAAEIAETKLGDFDRAASLLHRGYRAGEREALERAFVELHERHGHWVALDAWLEQRRKDTEGPARARWARMRADRLVRSLDDISTAAQLYAESDRLVPDPAVGLAAARAELRSGAYEACLTRCEDLLLRPGLESRRVEVVVLAARGRVALNALAEAETRLAEARDAEPTAEVLFDEWLEVALSRGRAREALPHLANAEGPLSGERALDGAQLSVHVLENRPAAATLFERARAEGGVDPLLLFETSRVLDRPEALVEALPAAIAQDELRGGASLELDRLEVGLRSGTEVSIDEIASREPRVRSRWASLRAVRAEQRGEARVANAAWAEAAAHLDGYDPKAAASLWRRVALAYAEGGELEAALDAAVRAEGGRIHGDLEREVLASTRPSAARAERMQARAEHLATAETWREAAEAWSMAGHDAEAEDAEREAMLLEGDLGEALARWLEARERWTDLLHLLEARLVQGVPGLSEERARLWTARVALRLGEAQRATTHLEAARARGVETPEVLDALYDAAVLREDEGAQLEVLEARATLAEVSEARAPALLSAAHIHARRERWAAALDALASAVDAEGEPDLRPWAEQAEAWALKADLPERAARGWAVYATSVSNNAEAGVAFARTADLRWRYLEDRRGALAAIDAARRRLPDDAGIAWMAVEMHEQLGDPDGSAAHALRAAERLPEGSARTAFLLAAARGDGGLEAWLRCTEEVADRDTVLDHLAAAHRMSPIDGLESAVARRGLRLPEPSVTALESGLEIDELRRAELDLGGRWSELASLEASRAEAIDDPRTRAEAWSTVASLWARVEDPSARGEAREALERAVESDPLWVRGVGEALRAAHGDGDITRARSLLEHAERLGGLPWPAPELELLAADLAEDDVTRRDALRRACSRDPGHREARAQLVDVLAQLDDLDGAEAEAALWSSRIDPILEPALSGRCRRRRAELAVRRGDPQVALRWLDPRVPEDARARLVALEAADAEPEMIVAAHVDAFDADGDVQHLIDAARRGAGLDELEHRAQFLATPSEELEDALIAARVREGAADVLLGWVRRRGQRALASTSTELRWEIARAAYREGDAPLVADLLRADEGAAGLEAVFSEDTLGALVQDLKASAPAERQLLARLAEHRVEDGAVARAWALRAPRDAGVETIRSACRRWLAHDPLDLAVLRRLEELAEPAAKPVVAAVVAWLERGAAVPATAPTWAEPTARPTHAGLRSHAWSPERRQPVEAANLSPELLSVADQEGVQLVFDPWGGRRPRVGPEGELVLGAGLADAASPEELRFHIGRFAAWRAGTAAPSRAGLRLSGCLASTFDGLMRIGPPLPRLSTSSSRMAWLARNEEARDLVVYCLCPPRPS